MTTANATTSSTGAMLYFQNTSGSLKEDRDVYNVLNPNKVNILCYVKGMLNDLFNTKYDMLVRHILEEYPGKFKITNKCEYGKSASTPIVLEIRIKMKHDIKIFRQVRNSIYKVR